MRPEPCANGRKRDIVGTRERMLKICCEGFIFGFDVQYIFIALLLTSISVL